MFDPTPSLHPVASFWLDVADKAIKALAVMIGFGWTVINFKISRTFQDRIEVSVTGTLHRREYLQTLIVNCQIKNVGQVRYDIEQKGTCVEVFGCAADGSEELIQTIEVFKDHQWIEPLEVIVEPKWLAISEPDKLLAIKAAVRIVSNKIEWNGSCIVAIDNNQEEERKGSENYAEDSGVAD
jgi:hypothetical protein